MTTTSSRPVLTAALLLLQLLASAPAGVRGQRQQGSSPASCTASLLTSFTPCFSYLTNSTGAAPTRDCCRSLAALVNASAGCACLVLTGAVPLGGLPAVNRTLAVSLPSACGSSTAVPLQCQDTSTSTPTPTPTPAAPGPVAADAPSQQLTPLPPATPAEQPTATAPVSQGQTRQTTVLPSSARRRPGARVPGDAAAAAVLLLLAVGAALV